MNNLVRNSELTIWMVSILPPGSPTELFQSSYHYHQVILYIPKFGLAFHTSALMDLVVKKVLASLLQFLCLTQSPIFPDLFPEAYSFNGTAEASHIPAFGHGENKLGAVLEKAALWPVSSRQACQDLQVLPENTPVPAWRT
ncbi:hypothetical protein ILYODFUR_012098, partial [Ilyodon furcidens]